MTVALRSLPKVVNFKLRRGKIRIETVTRANVLNHFTKPKIKCFGEFLKSMLLLVREQTSIALFGNFYLFFVSWQGRMLNLISMTIYNTAHIIISKSLIQWLEKKNEGNFFICLEDNKLFLHNFISWCMLRVGWVAIRMNKFLFQLCESISRMPEGKGKLCRIFWKHKTLKKMYDCISDIHGSDSLRVHALYMET